MLQLSLCDAPCLFVPLPHHFLGLNLKFINEGWEPVGSPLDWQRMAIQVEPFSLLEYYYWQPKLSFVPLSLRLAFTKRACAREV